MKRLRITIEGKAYEVEVEVLDGGDPGVSLTAPTRPKRTPAVAAAAPAAPAPKAAAPASGGPGSVTSPLAAVVVSIDVAVGAEVQEGTKLITLEAMKMNTIVSSPAAGKVGAIHVQPGDGVEEGQLLITMS